MKRAQLSDLKDGPSVPRKKNSPEIVKFYFMTLHPFETYLSLFKRLSLQADKCNFTDNSRELMRARLIPLIKDTRLQQELANADNNCLEDILTKYTAHQTITHVLSMILPYVSLAELHAVSQIDFQVKAIVRDYISSGQNLIVNRNVLHKYPVVTHRDFYAEYGTMTTDLTIQDISESDLKEIISCFKRIERLTLIEITAKTELPEPKQFLRALHLIRCQIRKPYLKNWFRDPKVSYQLDTLYIDHLTDHPAWTIRFHTTGLEYPCTSLTLENFPELNSLTIKGHVLKMTILVPQLKSLKIVAAAFMRQSCDGVKCRFLETLVFDVADRMSYKEFSFPLPNLRSLTTKYLDVNCLPGGSVNEPRSRSYTISRDAIPQGPFPTTTKETYTNLGISSDISHPSGFNISSTNLPRLEELRVYHSVDPVHRDKLTHIKTLDVHFYDALTTPNVMVDKDELLLTIAGYLPVKDLISFAGSHPRIGHVLTMGNHFASGELNLLPTSPYADIEKGFQYALVTKLKCRDFSDSALVNLLPHFPRLRQFHLCDCPVLNAEPSEAFLQTVRKMSMLTSLTITSLNTDKTNAAILQNVNNWQMMERIGRASRKAEHPIYPRSLLTRVGHQLTELVVSIENGCDTAGIFQDMCLSKLEHLQLIPFEPLKVFTPEDNEILRTIRTVQKFTFGTGERTSFPFLYKRIQSRTIIWLMECWPQLVAINIPHVSLGRPNDISEYLQRNNRKLIFNNREF